MSRISITEQKPPVTSQLNMMPKKLPLPLLRDITGDFSKELEIGRGAFGALYRVCKLTYFPFYCNISHNNAV